MFEKLDKFFNKILPKKFIVITIATVIVFLKLDPPVEYWWLLMAYFGLNVVGKFTNGSKD